MERAAAAVEDRGRSLRLAADLALLGVAAGWGLTFPFAKTVQQSIPTFTYLALRFGAATVVLLAIAMLRRTSMTPRAWGVAAGVGGVLFLGFALQAFGIRLTTASRAGFITGLSVAMVPIISSMWLRRPPRPLVIVGVVAATIGLALMTAGDAAVPVNAGDLLVLGCAACFALHIVLVGRLARAWDAVWFATVQVAAVAVLSALAAFVERPGHALAAAPASAWGMIAYMTFMGTVAALLVQTWAQRFTTPTHTGLMFAFEPVAAALAAVALLGESLAGRPAAGAALILAGIVMAELARDEGRKREALNESV
jgi:drug/metabolite transporter (DMT)-like permease